MIEITIPGAPVRLDLLPGGLDPSSIFLELVELVPCDKSDEAW